MISSPKQTIFCFENFKNRVVRKMTTRISCVKMQLTETITHFIATVRASIFSRTELLAYRTEPCYIGTPKKIISFSQKLFGFAKVWFGTVREKFRFGKKSMRVLYLYYQDQIKHVLIIVMFIIFKASLKSLIILVHQLVSEKSKLLRHTLLSSFNLKSFKTLLVRGLAILVNMVFCVINCQFTF